MNTYPRGTSVKVSVEFRAVETAALFDPDAVVCLVKAPDGTESELVYGVDDEVVRDGVGAYHMWVEGDQSGAYYYRWKGDGDTNVANEAEFYIDESAFTAP